MEMGFRCPEDISVVSAANDLPDEECAEITGIKFDLDKNADLALDELVSYLRNPAYRPGRHCTAGVFNEGATLKALH